MKRPHQRAPAKRHGKTLYFADEPADFRYIDADNKLAKPYDPTQCGFACSWQRLGYTAEIGRKYSYIDYGPYIVKYCTPALMQRQLTANDQGGLIAPGDYRLNPIPPSDRQPRKAGKVRGGGGGNPRTAPLGPDLVRRRLAS